MTCTVAGWNCSSQSGKSGKRQSPTPKDRNAGRSASSCAAPYQASPSTFAHSSLCSFRVELLELDLARVVELHGLVRGLPAAQRRAAAHEFVREACSAARRDGLWLPRRGDGEQSQASRGRHHRAGPMICINIKLRRLRREAPHASTRALRRVATGRAARMCACLLYTSPSPRDRG